MIEIYKREINQNELKKLQEEIEQIGTQVKKGNKIFLGMFLVILIIGTPLALSQIKKGHPDLIILAFVVLLIYLWIVWSTKRQGSGKSIKRIENIKKTISQNVAETLHCKTTEMVELQEYEDEGMHYLFQVEPDKILSVAGQQYYEIKNFPNSDFEIVTIYGPNKYCVYLEIYCYGQQLASKQVIDRKTKWDMAGKYDLPGDLEILAGRLENIEEIIKSRKIAGA